MNTLGKNVFCLTMFTLSLASSQAIADVAIIVNPANSATISIDEVKSLFSGRQKGFSDGKTALILSLDESDAARSEFNNKVLGKTDAQMKAYWSKLLFTGKGTPPKEISASEMLQLVADNPNTIGYIDAAGVNDTVKVVATF